jgi:hypothetical protein
MPSDRRWEVRKIDCPEQTHVASLVIEWDHGDRRAVIKSICCDNPRFHDLNNWDCQWSCWEKLEGVVSENSNALWRHHLRIV